MQKPADPNLKSENPNDLHVMEPFAWALPNCTPWGRANQSLAFYCGWLIPAWMSTNARLLWLANLIIDGSCAYLWLA